MEGGDGWQMGLARGNLEKVGREACGEVDCRTVKTAEPAIYGRAVQDALRDAEIARALGYVDLIKQPHVSFTVAMLLRPRQQEETLPLCLCCIKKD